MNILKNNTDLGLLLVRVGLGLVFIAHGWAKIAGMEDTVGFFASIGLSAFWAYLVAYVEFIGGIAMLVGLFTNWAGMLLAVVMIVAIAMLKLSKGFVGGYEFDLVLFLSSLAIVIAGPGKYTLRALKKA